MKTSLADIYVAIGEASVEDGMCSLESASKVKKIVRSYVSNGHLSENPESVQTAQVEGKTRKIRAKSASKAGAKGTAKDSVDSLMAILAASDTPPLPECPKEDRLKEFARMTKVADGTKKRTFTILGGGDRTLVDLSGATKGLAGLSLYHSQIDWEAVNKDESANEMLAALSYADLEDIRSTQDLPAFLTQKNNLTELRLRGNTFTNAAIQQLAELVSQGRNPDGTPTQDCLYPSLQALDLTLSANLTEFPVKFFDVPFTHFAVAGCKNLEFPKPPASSVWKDNLICADFSCMDWPMNGKDFYNAVEAAQNASSILLHGNRPEGGWFNKPTPIPKKFVSSLPNLVFVTFPHPPEGVEGGDVSGVSKSLMDAYGFSNSTGRSGALSHSQEPSHNLWPPITIDEIKEGKYSPWW